LVLTLARTAIPKRKADMPMGQKKGGKQFPGEKTALGVREGHGRKKKGKKKKLLKAIRSITGTKR